MAKVFTITEGLENLGALRTGGQGSVYKGRRIGEIYTAVKLLPTPIYSESADDKNFQSFQNEVLKLKKVNEVPNPNVVKIMNSGITESGSFPFIEMEFIEGPDLEDLLKPPHDPVFTIREVIKVADQLSNALAHCHKVGVKHGDIKSNNVKLNIHTANYVLLDFGLAVMSDEQRRTSLRHAGAIEFMAPEQNEGQMLFQTDIYSFGVILFELLAGVVPFPLKDSGETNRNTVMLSHMESPVPDVLASRRANLPEAWASEKKEMEMQVPDWLLKVIYKCLEKSPEARFENGVRLHDAIVHNSTIAVEKAGGALVSSSAAVLQAEITQLQAELARYQKELTAKDQEIVRLKAELDEYEDDEDVAVASSQPSSSGMNISQSSMVAIILLIIGLATFGAYSYFSKDKDAEKPVPAIVEDSTSTEAPVERAPVHEPVEIAVPEDTIPDTTEVQPEVIEQQPADTAPATSGDQPGEETQQADGDQSTTKVDVPTAEEIGSKKKYTLAVNKAYFHDQPDESTRRNAFLVIWNNAELTALDEQKGFIYVTFFNTQGQITKGWLRKKDLKRMR